MVGKKVVSIELAEAKIRAACSERVNPETWILARTEILEHASRVKAAMVDASERARRADYDAGAVGAAEESAARSGGV